MFLTARNVIPAGEDLNTVEKDSRVFTNFISKEHKSEGENSQE